MQGECSSSQRRYWLAALFLGVTFGFVAYRHSSFAVWNDSSALFHPHDSSDVIGPDELAEHFHNDPLGTLWSFGVRRSFTAMVCGGYRPLTEMWVNLSAIFFYTPNPLPLPLLLLVGAVLAALAVSVFYVARRFVRHDLTALGAVLLVMGSPPLVGSAWVCVAGVQSFVPLLFCLSLLCYWNLIENRHRVLCATGLVLLLFFGPWVREFFGLNAVLLILLELRRARRPTRIMATAALGFLHALFPTALIHWLFLPQVPLLPVYKIGLLSGQLGNGGIRWFAAWHFIPLFPPMLWVCAILEALLNFRVRFAGADESREENAWKLENVVQRLVLPCALFVMLTLAALQMNSHDYLGVAITLILALLGMRRDLFLGCWFLFMYLPILRVFSEHVHFLYAIPPAAIILAGTMESLWLRLRGWPVLACVRVPLACVIGVIGLDQTLNIYGAYCVNRAAYGGIDRVGDWFVQHVPQRAAVVTNVIHGEEIKWHSGNHIDVYWTLNMGIPDTRRAVEQPSQLEDLLAHRGDRKTYFLDVDFDYTADKAWNHGHKYVHHADIDRRDLGIIHFSHARFPFADPLRYLIPRIYQPFLGAPDLENDFARKCSVDHPFRQEIYAAYHVYEVTGRRVTPRLDGPIQLMREDVNGFNIVRVGLGFYAIPRGEGAFEPGRFHLRNYSKQFSGLTVEAVCEQIRASSRRGGEEAASHDNSGDR